MLHEFSYAAPRSRSELFAILGENQGRAKVLAGGTDLLVNIRAGVFKPELVVDLKKVDGYAGISRSGGDMILGPAVTINEIIKDKTAAKRFPLLRECGHDLASYQIRNRATVAGNVVNASPCSDMAPALLCLGASALIASGRGTRELPFKDFFTGVKKTVLTAEDVLEGIRIPAASEGGRGSYRKLKRIAGHDLGIVGVAVCILGDALRIAVSSAAPTPVLVEGLPADISAEEAVAAVMGAVSPISDVRCSQEYREFMIGVFVRRLLKEVRR